MSAMNRPELVSIVAQKTGLTKAATDRYLRAVEDSVVEAVADGREVKITGFAAFSRVTRAPRTMMNPRTAREMNVKATHKVRIRPLKRFLGTVAETPVEEVPEDK